jgi:putative transposase
MSRPLRIQFPGAVYHVMNRGRVRQPIFLRPEDYQAFLDTLAAAHRRWGIEVFAFCLMRNHYHVCLRTPQGNLARVMRHVDGLYTQRFNRSHGRDGSLFRGRYKALIIEADDYLSAVVRYIHLNPLEARIAKNPEEYRWSSHRHYLQVRGVPDWLNAAEVLEQLGGRKAFHEFVCSGNEAVVKEFYESGRQHPVLGGEQFVEQVRGRMGKVSREHPRYQRQGLQVSPEQVIQRVAGRYEISREEILRGGRGKENEARKVAMYLVQRCCDQTLQETARVFGLRSYGAVGWCCHGVKSKMAKDEKFRSQVARLASEISQQKI